MSIQVPFSQITLEEEDVPGAKLLPNVNVEAHNVVLLKRWLHCRKQCNKGKKKDLVARVKLCLANDVKVDPSVDGGKWLTIKENNVRNTSLIKKTVIGFPIAWDQFPSAIIPEAFNYGSIFNHLITTCTLENSEIDNKENRCNDEDYSTAKPLKRGQRYFDSGHVQNMEDSLTHEEKHYCARATVLASYKVNFKYSVCIMLHKETGDVLDGRCECKASTMGRCSHVSALLYAILDFVMTLKTDKSCTSNLCKWNQGRKSKLPVKINENKYTDKCDKLKIQNFNPCTESKELNCERQNSFLCNLQEESLSQKSISMWELLLEPQYADYELDVCRKAEVLEMVQEFQQTLTFNAKGPPEVTSGLQSSSETWKKLRKLLITASNIKTFILPKTPMQLFNLIRRHLWEEIIIVSDALSYGKEKELIAKNQYKEHTECLCFDVQDTGLWVNPKYPGIGASPDALVYDPLAENHLGLLEIKCPKVLEHLKPTEINRLNKGQLSRFSCVLEGEELILKTNSEYYYQIQTQMCITERYWCDFMVWTPLGFHIQRIKFNSDFAKQVLQAASKFHKNILSPEYFEMRVPRQLVPFNFEFEN